MLNSSEMYFISSQGDDFWTCHFWYFQSGSHQLNWLFIIIVFEFNSHVLFKLFCKRWNCLCSNICGKNFSMTLVFLVIVVAIISTMFLFFIIFPAFRFCSSHFTGGIVSHYGVFAEMGSHPHKKMFNLIIFFLIFHIIQIHTEIRNKEQCIAVKKKQFKIHHKVFSLRQHNSFVFEFTIILL